MKTHLGIQQRIVIPFALVAIVTTSGAAFVARSLLSRTLESRVVAQVSDAATVLSQSDFALNPQILRSARQIAGADITTFTVAGDVLATTFADGMRGSVLARVATPDAARDALGRTDGSAVVRHVPGPTPLIVAYRTLQSRAGTVVAVAADTSELTAITRAITRSILLVTTISLLLMIVVSQFVARRVTAPLDALVAFTRTVSPEGSGGRAPVGDDEVGRLGAAFNDMLDRLGQSQGALLRSEKLALAGLMAARVAHEIRNPLSSIKMHTQLLGSRYGQDTTASPLIGAVLHNVDLVESVVRNLIELARPGELTRQPTALGDVVLDVQRQLALQLTHRKIDVRCTIADHLPLVPLDEARFRQALLNVVGNAADAMPVGGTLTIALVPGKDGQSLVLDIADDGVGIDPGIRDRLFDPFVSTKRDGVGLGLVNVKAVVQAHGGTIQLTSVAPRGTLARITLPISTPAAGDIGTPAGTHV
ncbi:MAG: ATP-binding protein [Acidobacteriota bacterium]